MMKKMIRNAIITFGIFLLAGCSFFSPVKTDSPNKYLLNRIPAVVPTKPTRSITLLVFAPETQPIFNTTQMAYTIKPYQIAYFSKNQWAETPTEMLQPLLVQT